MQSNILCIAERKVKAWEILQTIQKMLQRKVSLKA